MGHVVFQASSAALLSNGDKKIWPSSCVDTMAANQARMCVIDYQKWSYSGEEPLWDRALHIHCWRWIFGSGSLRVVDSRSMPMISMIPSPSCQRLSGHVITWLLLSSSGRQYYSHGGHWACTISLSFYTQVLKPYELLNYRFDLKKLDIRDLNESERKKTVIIYVSAWASTTNKGYSILTYFVSSRLVSSINGVPGPTYKDRERANHTQYL